jgi:hypothetical protein
MKHAATKELFAYWDRSRGERPLPDRSDMEPRHISRILGDTFVVAADADYSFRLAGTRVCALFDRELRDTSFLELWHPQSRGAIETVLTTSTEERAGAVASVCARTADQRDVLLELLLLPLNHRGEPSRLIGSLVPMKIPFWLEVIPLEHLSLGALRHVGPPIRDSHLPSLVAPPTGAAQRERFVVHEGGRRD